MSSELELLKDVEPALADFAEATGALQPIRELNAMLAESIRYRWRLPHTLRLLRRAAEKARESGIPPSGIADRYLAAIVESGALEDDESMQERWASLLAREATVGDVAPALPEILKQLEPVEAKALDRLAVTDRSSKLADLQLTLAQAGNLERLGLIAPDAAHRSQDLFGPESKFLPTTFGITPLGAKFVECCQVPIRAS